MSKEAAVADVDEALNSTVVQIVDPGYLDDSTFETLLEMYRDNAERWDLKGVQEPLFITRSVEEFHRTHDRVGKTASRTILFYHGYRHICDKWGDTLRDIKKHTYNIKDPMKMSVLDGASHKFEYCRAVTSETRNLRFSQNTIGHIGDLRKLIAFNQSEFIRHCIAISIAASPDQPESRRNKAKEYEEKLDKWINETVYPVAELLHDLDS